MQRLLPIVEVKSWKGLYTKGSEEILEPTHLRVAQNVDYTQKYGAIGKIRGNKRLLTTQYTESSVVKPISWVGFYKSPDYNGQVKRKVLVACGTKLGSYNGSTAIDTFTDPGYTVPTDIVANRQSGLPHVAAQVGRLLFIQNQDPKNIGYGNTPVKYDGVDVFQWGLTAPGSQETIITGSDDVTKWAADGTNTVALINDNSLDGASIGLTKVTTAAASASATFTPAATFAISALIPNRTSIALYIPAGALHKLRQTTTNAAVEVAITSDAGGLFTNYTWIYKFFIGGMFEGWNILKLDASPAYLSDGVTLAPNTTWNNRFLAGANDANPAAINKLKVTIYTKDNATTFQNLGIDKVKTLDDGAPISDTGSGTGGTIGGVYSYRVTFVSKYGVESNAGPASRPKTVTSNSTSISVTAIPVSLDPQVVARRLYRTLGGGTLPLRIVQIEDNTTTTYTDTTTDVAISEKTPPFAGDPSFDSSPPPRAGIIKAWKDTIFLAGDPLNPNSVVYSEPGDCELFPLLNKKILDAPITAMYETYSSLIIETESGKWQVTGDGPDYNFDKIVDGMGTVGPRAAGTSRIMGWTIDRDGLRMYDASSSPYKASEVIRDLYDAIDKTYVYKTHSCHSRPKNMLLQFFPNASGVYDTSFQYQYVADTPQMGFWSTLNLPGSVDIKDAREVEDSIGNLHIYAGSTGGMLYELYEENTKSFHTDTSTSNVAITTQFKSPWMRIGEETQTVYATGSPGHNASGRTLPRMIEIRASGDATTWTLTIESAEGPASTSLRDTISIPVVFDAGKSLKRISMPNTFATDEFLRFTLTNSDAEVSSIIMAYRVLFLPPSAGHGQVV